MELIARSPSRDHAWLSHLQLRQLWHSLSNDIKPGIQLDSIAPSLTIQFRLSCLNTGALRHSKQTVKLQDAAVNKYTNPFILQYTVRMDGIAQASCVLSCLWILCTSLL